MVMLLKTQIYKDRQESKMIYNRQSSSGGGSNSNTRLKQYCNKVKSLIKI